MAVLSFRLPFLLSLLLLPLSLVQAASFKVEDIRVEGLRRISAGTVFNYLPVQIGQSIQPAETGEIVRALYRTGFFKDVRLERRGNVLVVYVQESPAIAKIRITGNKAMEEKPLLQALRDIGLAEGRVFSRSVLDRIERELNRQYYSLGKYGMNLTSTVTPLENNRVAINIVIAEGESARIKQINIIGNHAFSEGTLRKQMKLSTGGWLASFTKENQYSRQKLSGDLEALKSFYMDRGYINFRIDSTQVTISPNKKDIYVTVNIHEGDVFEVSDLRLAGNLAVDPQQIFPLVEITRGEVFSRKKVIKASEKISELLGDSGYAFANINSIPDIDEANKKVALTFFVDPGKRVYVRRIHMKGNTRTRDEVLRREFRQMESGWFSTSKIKLSKDRLQRLGYFEDVSVETKPVPGSADQVDVDVSVKEKASGSIMAGLGYSQSQGVMFNTSINQTNFLGTGKRIGFAFNTSEANTLYQLAYTNPYYTVDGISRGFSLKYSSTDYKELDLSNYNVDTAQVGVNFGIPVNETDSINLGFDIENNKMRIGGINTGGRGVSGEIEDFIDPNGVGKRSRDYTNFRLSADWSRDSSNHMYFPTKGTRQTLGAEITIPGSDLEYYKLGYRHQQYFPVVEDSLTLAVKLDVGYADSYGDTKVLPFYENYFAGGPKSVRGFKDYSLGPKGRVNSAGGGSLDPIGGQLKTVGNIELYFPPPFSIGEQKMRFSAFVDVGNVFKDADSFRSEDLRASAGVSMVWLSPVGPLGISVAEPINKKKGDDTQVFQFTLGSAF